VARVSERGKSKVRPLLVVQNDRNNARLTNLIVAMVTSTAQRAGKEATQVLVETQTPEGQATGLRHCSAITCENLYTIETRSCRKIGILPVTLLHEVDQALKVSLDLK